MKRLLSLFALVLILPFAHPVTAQSGFTQADIEAAPECGKGRDLKDGEAVLCKCKARGFDRFVWGTGPYTGHSDVCTAARHAGIITKADGGVIVATGRPGQKEYTEGEANGIKGRRWGRFSNSFDVTLAGGAATADLPACQGFSANAAPYECACPAAQGSGRSVWGSGPYTGDSDVCTAARHAGAVGADGGAITVTLEPGQSSYTGSQANGVSTSNWGSYDQSFMPRAIQMQASAEPCKGLLKGVESFQCSCEAASGNGGSVWGSGPYTGDSDICSAARHAGAVSDAGGVINVMIKPGESSYNGSEANGVKTGSWGSYGQSFMPASLQAAVTGDACGTMPTGADNHSCACPAASGNSGSVWGSGPYTADSDICTAARHAGVVGDQGGMVNVMRVMGLKGYKGSSANGAKTGDWGGFDSSIMFNLN